MKCCNHALLLPTSNCLPLNEAKKCSGYTSHKAPSSLVIGIRTNIGQPQLKTAMFLKSQSIARVASDMLNALLADFVCSSQDCSSGGVFHPLQPLRTFQ